MKKVIMSVSAMLVCMFVVSAAMAEGPTMRVSGKAEIWVEASDGLDSNKGDSKMKANELYVTFDGKFDNDVSAKLKLDGADIVSNDGKVTSEKIVEEANFTFKHIAGSPVSLVIGKDEMPFGQDYDKMLSDPLVHNFEIDKVWGLNSSVDLAGIGSLGAATYYHRNSASDRVGPDNELGDNYAVRLKLDKLIDAVAFQASFAQESYSELSVTDEADVTTVTPKDDETRVSVGVVIKVAPVNVAVEYVGVQNRKGMPGYDPALVSVAGDVKVCDNVKLHAKYERILEDADDAVEEDFFGAGLECAVADGVAVFVEYLNYNSGDLKDASDLEVADGSTEDSVKVGVRGKF
ncbi:MAG: porin [Verrucomicrobia bacterium]|nr:porin [Verrucomicrobiota bacterium]MBT7069218.1 porin [Verrucomicrobiota bacterium]MBT7700212.1 porin [Verrucomicrobiota bacterium]